MRKTLKDGSGFSRQRLIALVFLTEGILNTVMEVRKHWAHLGKS